MIACYTLLMLFLLGPGYVAQAERHGPSRIVQYISDAAGRRLEESVHKVSWHKDKDASGNSAVIKIEANTFYQQFDGLGGSFMRAGAHLMNKLPSSTQRSILEDLFDQNNGKLVSLYYMFVNCAC